MNLLVLQLYLPPIISLEINHFAIFFLCFLPRLEPFCAFFIIPLNWPDSFAFFLLAGFELTHNFMGAVIEPFIKILPVQLQVSVRLNLILLPNVPFRFLYT